ncbi:SKP1/ASK-interacting protein 5 [Wolffia australiana]
MAAATVAAQSPAAEEAVDLEETAMATFPPSSVGRWKRRKKGTSVAVDLAPINCLDDGCLMHIFSLLSPIPDRYSTALVCQRWRHLACHPRHWLRVERPSKAPQVPGVFPDLESAISAARPGDTILISAGGSHPASDVQVRKPLCLVGGGDIADDTILTCSRGSDSAIEFLSTCKVVNLTVRAELGCCFLHRSGRLTIEDCVLQCEENALDFLSFPIVSTAQTSPSSSSRKHGEDRVTVAQTRIEGGAKAVLSCGTLTLQHVRAIYAPKAIFFWFEAVEK